MEVKLDSLHLVIAKPEYYSSTGVLTDVVIVTQNNYEEEVSINSPIISNAGLFGRVTESDKNRFNILPIFHSSSRIPVYTKKSKIYGVALGNGFEIELIYLSENVNQIIEDEEVLTSGENNLLISDIPVGVIKIDGKRIKIKPFAEKRPQLLGIITSK
jgi:cell shape-determining protein MreC